MAEAPLILITAAVERPGRGGGDFSMHLANDYARGITEAGGIPWVLPCLTSAELMAECVRRAGGVLLTGGDDVQPELYASRLPERLKRTVRAADPARDLSELLLIREIFRQGKPVLAICRGQQLLHVAFGGKLIADIEQDVPGALGHAAADRPKELVHPISVAPESRLLRILGKDKLMVNSSHHQGFRETVHPFRMTAVSPDGIVEAMELQLAEEAILPYLLAVQFHPERLIERCPEFLELFRSLIQASSAA